MLEPEWEAGGGVCCCLCFGPRRIFSRHYVYIIHTRPSTHTHTPASDATRYTISAWHIILCGGPPAGRLWKQKIKSSADACITLYPSLSLFVFMIRRRVPHYARLLDLWPPRSFRWKFNNSGETLDVGKERFHRNGSTSILQYTPVTDQVCVVELGYYIFRTPVGRFYQERPNLAWYTFSIYYISLLQFITVIRSG